jgi:ribose transport system ATP-binding protein
VCVLYVSHHLEEIIRIADRYTVLRDGRTVEAATMEGATIAGLTRLLLGRPATAEARPARERGAPLLEVRELHGKKLPRGASLELHRGEVLGVAGLVGSGRTELLRAIFALDPVKRGTVRVLVGGHGAERARGPADRIRHGVGMTSEDRKSEGVVGAMSVADNLTLSRLGDVTRVGLVSEAAQRAAAAALVERLSIRTAGESAITSTLSGGNQQKVAIGRLIHQDADVLLLDEPTRGIDLRSREQIYDIVDDLVRRGKGVLWISSQLGELLRVCDRIATMKRGVLSPPVLASTLTEHSLLEEISAG